MNDPHPESDESSPHDSEIMRLLTSHQGMLYAFILSIHPNRVAAQDILQETNMVIWKKRALFEPGTNFKAWSFRFAHFQTLAHLKRVKNREWMVFSEKLMESMSEEACEALDDFDQRSGALKNCLAKLSPTDQDLIRSHYQSGLPLAELGGRLGRTRAAIKQALLRVRRNLRTCIERQLRADEGPISDFTS
ncbi:MAG: sigma-70 family RNA polymerase sigma factor [Akkermansiaceae bacterium]|jgi:RNA polymerase sigma-70 factor, ECF subfamily|nr:sigma-70 family RNA polymerase sigma factor [Akkermansiaceae bacterium]